MYSQILDKTTTPMEFSSYPKLIELLKKVEANSLKKASWTDRSDLKLRAQLQQSNADKGYATFEEYFQQSSNGVSLALEYGPS